MTTTTITITTPQVPLLEELEIEDEKINTDEDQIVKRSYFFHAYISQRQMLGLLGLFAMTLLFMLRVNLSIALIPMAELYGWNDSTKGLILSSFFVGYMTTQVPGGILAKKFGPKPILMFGILGASFTEMLIPIVAFSTPLLVLCRISSGICEGVVFPALHQLLSNWIPSHETSRYVAVTWSGCTLGTIISMLGMPFVVTKFGWPMVFYSTSTIALLWGALWFYFGANTPQESKWIANSEVEYLTSFINPDEAKLQRKVPWKGIMTSLPVWTIIANHFAVNWAFYIVMAWLPTYLTRQFEFNLEESGFLSFLPFFTMFIVSFVSGKLTDTLIVKGYPVQKVRKATQVLCILPTGILYLLLCLPVNSTMAILIMMAAVGFLGLEVCGYATNSIEIAPEYSGIIMGVSNTIATLPGIIGVYITGVLLEAFNSWITIWVITAVICISAGIMWALFSTTNKINLQYDCFFLLFFC